ncbi:MAG: ABC transporter ATP-binding protein [Candidatus Eremiobacteraeota bacterium]|nr:ABC transporter ATP-binding protein [Candidatus Eremiobacteraeota bacterium]MBV8356185.1 ABC transporter ATP-binding protein [Candidatus Eremiobacteraeota bacterium]
MALLEVRDLEAGYGDFKALHGVSFTVEQNEIVSIIGANGAGKTTTLKALLGIIRPVAGSIDFDGTAIAGRRPRETVERGLALVPEGRHLFRDMTVEENLAMGGHVPRARRRVRARAAEMYARFPVVARLRRRQAGTLSGGEQQMVAIARALMSEPKVLLMDEPSLGLAPIVTLELFSLIREIHERGIAIVLVEQNVVQALELADRAYVLAEGKTVMEGEAAAIRANDEVKRRFLGEV